MSTGGMTKELDSFKFDGIKELDSFWFVEQKVLGDFRLIQQKHICKKGEQKRNGDFSPLPVKQIKYSIQKVTSWRSSPSPSFSSVRTPKPP